MKNHTFASLNNRSNPFSNLSKSRANTVKETIKPPSLKLRWVKGAVAQSVEQKTENLCVGGSIPSHTTNNLCKSIVYRGFFMLVTLWVTLSGPF